MKKCTYCGKEYPDEALACAIDQAPLQTDVPAPSIDFKADITDGTKAKTPIYSPKQIFAGSFLGGPVAVVYFLRRNFQTLKNPAAATQTLWWGIGFNLAILTAMPFLPKHFPNYVLPLAYAWAARLIADSKQMSKESIAASSQFCFQSNWRVFGLACAYVIGTCVLWFSILLALDYFNIIHLE